MACGYRVGTYTSPHLQSYTERFCINTIPISDVKLTQLLTEILDHPESQTLTEFECLTAAAFVYFFREKPDFLILETGLGGRLDATNVVIPKLSIITKIGWDHQAVLGDTLVKIASEKAGIIKPNVPVITLSMQPKDVPAVIQTVAKNNHSPLIEVSPQAAIPSHYRMKGAYQKDNLALAKAALTYILPKADAAKIDQGLADAKIWGRYDLQKTKSGILIIDAAHNEMGVLALIAQLKHDYPTTRPTFFIGFYAPKNAIPMMQLFLDAGDVYYTEFDPELAYPFEKLKAEFPNKSITKIDPNHVQKEAEKQALSVISGSIYFIGGFYKKTPAEGL